MTISSINTNLAALLAQTNIGNATAATANDVAALSSGNRIVQASDDVAALAAGTALQSQVNTLNTSLTVASQGSSLLQVADGALAQIQSVLQRQQAIATQAQSGSLSSTQLGFLDEEFQNLSAQVDQLSGTTNFNGVNLLNGSISGGASVASNTSTNNTAAAAGAKPLFTFSAAGANGDSVSVDGVTVKFTTAAPGTAAAAGEVSVGGSATTDAANLAAFLNSSGDPQFANLYFTAAAGSVTAQYTGGTVNGTVTITTAASSANVTSAATTVSIVPVAGGLGLGVNTTNAVGAASGSILASGGTTAQTTGASFDFSGVKNNASFVGTIGGANSSIGAISATFDTAGNVSLSLSSGGITYTTGAINVVNAGAITAATFTGHDASGAAAGGAFTLNINGSSTAALTNQQQANAFATQLNSAVSTVTLNQNRNVTSFGAGLTASVGGVQTATLQNASVFFNSSNFSNPIISNITVTAPTAGTTDAKITAQINGDTYSSIGGIGSQISTGQILTLQDTSNPANTFQIVAGNTAIAGSTNKTAIDLTTAANASAFQNTLSNALGISSANASLTFQVGSSTTDTIGVSIGSASTSALFGGQHLDVLTQSDAATAANQLTTALNTVTALRSNVGALEERFNFASSALQNAAQNEGAAKSTLLDTDVSAESSTFATSQVQLQAGIAVLAQANQLSQNLLKLV